MNTIHIIAITLATIALVCNIAVGLLSLHDGNTFTFVLCMVWVVLLVLLLAVNIAMS